MRGEEPASPYLTPNMPCAGRDEARPSRAQPSERAGPSDQDREGSNLERKSATNLERRSGNEAQKQAARRKPRPSAHDLHTGGAAYSDREPGLSAEVLALLKEHTCSSAGRLSSQSLAQHDGRHTVLQTPQDQVICEPVRAGCSLHTLDLSSPTSLDAHG